MELSRFEMTSMSADRVAVLGTGLIGTSIALAAVRSGHAVTGWDAEPQRASGAGTRGRFEWAETLEQAVAGSSIVFVCTPISTIPELVQRSLEAEPDAVATDVGSIKARVIEEVRERVPGGCFPRFVAGHPLGGSERSGPDHASASIVDGIVWVLAPTEATTSEAVARVEGFVRRVGARPVQMSAERHDRLVAFVSHLPQVAASTLMGLAAAEESDEPEILLLAAGGFRDLTRLAASDPGLWGEVLVANSSQIVEAIELYSARLLALRDRIATSDASGVEEAFTIAKEARLRLAAKPQVRAGIAVLQVEVADRPGALAHLTAILGEGGVNIEDLQIVHSPEGGRGTVHLTIAAATVTHASGVLEQGGFDPIRLA